MSEMSSFYGGRQGNSIVIAKHFDGIDIPQVKGAYNYTCSLYAVDKDNNFIITQDKDAEGAIGVGISDGEGNYSYSKTDFLIRKTKNNISGSELLDFGGWESHENNADRINETDYVFYPVLAEGMVQFFEQGAKTASEVKYGEYVIIDTIVNMSNYSDIDNGKIFRRGFNIAAEDGLAGAEYIGQIVGPQGDTPELNFTSYEEITEQNSYRKKQYDLSNEGLTPGSYYEDGERKFVDSIQYAWTNVQDSGGNLVGCNIGFKIPTLVQDFSVEVVNPYEEYEVLTPDPEYYNEELGTWLHPFYQKWHLSIPSGERGISSDSIEIIPSSTRKVESKGSEITVYETPSCDEIYTTISEEGKTYSVVGSVYKYIKDESDLDNDDEDGKANIDLIQGKNYIRFGSEYDSSPEVISCKINIDGTIKYVKKEDCCDYIIRYQEINYDSRTRGSHRYYYIGKCNDIEKITLEADGTLTAFYSGGQQVKKLEQTLRWIDKNAGGITFEDNGSVHIYYNTIIEEDGQQVHEHQDFNNLIQWIDPARGITLDPDGSVHIYYNIMTEEDGQQVNKHQDFNNLIKWINTIDADGITFDDDGSVHVYYNTYTEEDGQKVHEHQDFNGLIQWINTKDEEGIVFDEDGSIHVYYNTYMEDENGQRVHKHQDFSKLVDWVTSVNLTDEGLFTMTFNNDTVVIGQDESGSDVTGNVYSKTLKWIKDVTFDADGTITYFWNTGEVAYRQEKILKYIEDLQIQTGNEEGSGDQRVYIKYNNEKESTPIGNPLNYIIEMCIDNNYHLLVYYADPALRASLSDKHASYHSTKLNKDLTDWVDLGNVRGEPGGIHIIRDVSSLDELKKNDGSYLKPEDVGGSEEFSGWSCTLTDEDGTQILFYDYFSEEWYSAGNISSASADPNNIIVKSLASSEGSPSDIDVKALEVGGIWLALESVTFAS